MRIYTKTGDKGTTGLVGGSRVSKTDPRIRAIGEVDELNAALGWVRTATLPQDLDEILREAQARLFDLGAELATPEVSKFNNAFLDESDVLRLERSIDSMDDELPPLASFILPGGSEAAARLHLARSICRRAERAVLELRESSEIRDVAISFLNRLSDWLFTAARTTNHRLGVEDVEWTKRGE